jgi:hypothetical protein
MASTLAPTPNRAPFLVREDIVLFMKFILFDYLHPSLEKIKIEMRGSIFLEIFRMLREKGLQKKIYSQCGEDALASIYLPEARINYIDIGSGNPISGSNTYMFYKRKGNGVLVDLVDNNIKLSKLIRPRDKVLCRLVLGASQVESQNQKIKFWEMYPPGYSTASITSYESALQLGATLVRYSEIVTINFCEVWKLLNPSLPVFVSIDAEGFDFEILKTIDFDTYRPRVICVETPTKEVRKSIDFLLHNHGYLATGRTVLSSIYTDRSYLEKNDQMKHWA